MNNVSSVTITYNPDVDILKSQIFSLVNQVSNIILIDNGSSNIDSITDLVQTIDKVNLIKLDDNMGIAFAQNEGIKKARDLGSSHVILFDHDSEVPDGFISGLIDMETELIKNDIKVGAVGPIFSDADSGFKYPISKFKNESRFSGFKLVKFFLDDNFYYSEVYLLIASGCLVRMSVLDDVGYMDESLFIDNVDLEWCYRARSKGYKVYATSKARLVHRIGEGRRKILGKSMSIHSNIRKYYNVRNNLNLLKYDYVPVGAKVRCIGYVFTSFLIGLLDTKDKSDYIKMHYRAIKDFSLGISGKFKR